MVAVALFLCQLATTFGVVYGVVNYARDSMDEETQAPPQTRGAPAPRGWRASSRGGQRFPRVARPHSSQQPADGLLRRVRCSDREQRLHGRPGQHAHRSGCLPGRRAAASAGHRSRHRGPPAVVAPPGLGAPPRAPRRPARCPPDPCAPQTPRAGGGLAATPVDNPPRRRFSSSSAV